MSKRGENIYKRKDGRWEGRYAKGRKENGKLHYGYVYGKSYSETKEKLVKKKYYFAAIHAEHGIYAESLAYWLEQWLQTDVEHKAKTSTYASYKHKLHRYIYPTLGAIPLNQLTSQSIQQTVDELFYQKQLSITTIQVTFRILKKAVAAATQKELIAGNPCDNVVLPKKKRKVIRALSILEQKRLEKAALNDKKGLPILLSLYTGLRMGEIAALQWSDIDFEEQVIRVQHTYQRVPVSSGCTRTKLLLGNAKTDAAVRSIPFSETVKEWLLKQQTIASGAFVFMSKQGPVEPRLLTYHFQRIAKQAGLENIHFHQLRHTFATRCMEINGDVASISALLGHSSSKMTLDVYTDSMLEQRRTMIEILDGQRTIQLKRNVV